MLTICNKTTKKNTCSSEKVVCKVYFPQDTSSLRSLTSSWPGESSDSQEIRRFNMSKTDEFVHFFKLVTANVTESPLQIQMCYLDREARWSGVDNGEQWTAALKQARKVVNKQYRQLRFRVTLRDGEAVTLRPLGITSLPNAVTQQPIIQSTSCCIVPTTNTDTYQCFASNMMSVATDFEELQRQMQLMHRQKLASDVVQGLCKKKKSKKTSSNSAALLNECWNVTKTIEVL